MIGELERLPLDVNHAKSTTMPTTAANDPVLVPSVTFQSLQYLRLVCLLNLFCTVVFGYRKRVFEIPSRSRNRRETMTMTPTRSGGIGGTKTASNL